MPGGAVRRLDDDLDAAVVGAPLGRLVVGDRAVRTDTDGGDPVGGDAASNQDLSLKRAESVRAHLVSQGIPAEKSKATGLGSDRPVADNNTAEGRANNRRVEIVVTPMK